MDLDLFRFYQNLGRHGDRLDRIVPNEFDSANIDHAKKYLARSLNYIKNSDKADWNIYQMSDVDETVAKFKEMKVDYRLDEPSIKDHVSDDFDFVPIEKRNLNWMNKITKSISLKTLSNCGRFRAPLLQNRRNLVVAREVLSGSTSFIFQTALR